MVGIIAGSMATKHVSGVNVQPPASCKPVPSANQLRWQKAELLLFIHFGLKTYCVNYQGICDSTLFNPTNFDATHWVTTAKEGGFKGIVLVAKHDDGFCLWPTATTRYSVASSPWKGGKGDLVKEVADALHAQGMWFGIYLATWDRHFLASKRPASEYPAYYATQWKECLTNYGKVDEVWFDGNGSGNMVINWDTLYQLIRALQPGAVSFNGNFRDSASIMVRWPGNEDGDAGDPNWSFSPAPSANLAVADTARWFPAEADVTLQGSWFYDDTPVASLARFKTVYLTSVGRNGLGLINIAPNRTGRFDAASVTRLREFTSWVDSIDACVISRGASVMASSVRGALATFGAAQAVDTSYDTYWVPESTATAPWLEIDLGKTDTIRMVVVQEYVPLGQRVASHTIQRWNGSSWTTVVSGKTIGYKRIHQLATPIAASRVRLVVTASRAVPLINTFALVGKRTPETAVRSSGDIGHRAPAPFVVAHHGALRASFPELRERTVTVVFRRLDGKRLGGVSRIAAAPSVSVRLPASARGVVLAELQTGGGSPATVFPIVAPCGR